MLQARHDGSYAELVSDGIQDPCYSEKEWGSLEHPGNRLEGIWKLKKILDSVRNRLDQADKELKQLISVQTRKMNASLRSVTTIEDKSEDAAFLTGIAELE